MFYRRSLNGGEITPLCLVSRLTRHSCS
jgi:hypothetical protein